MKLRHSCVSKTMYHGLRPLWVCCNAPYRINVTWILSLSLSFLPPLKYNKLKKSQPMFLNSFADDDQEGNLYIICYNTATTLIKLWPLPFMVKGIRNGGTVTLNKLFWWYPTQFYIWLWCNSRVEKHPTSYDTKWNVEDEQSLWRTTIC